MTARWARRLIAVLTLTTLGVAHADSLATPDADDSPGRLDLVSVTHGHFLVQGTGQHLVRHVLRTAEPWRWATVDGLSRLELWFDIDRDRRPDRRMTIAVDHGTPYAVLQRLDGRIMGFARVWKPSRDRVAVEFPRHLLRADLRGYDWYAMTVFHRDDHPDCGTVGDVALLCDDRAPDRGRIEHSLR